MILMIGPLSPHHKWLPGCRRAASTRCPPIPVSEENLDHAQIHQWEVYLLCINHSLRSFNLSLGWYLIIPVAVLCFREMTFMSDVSLMLHFLLLSSAWTNERTAPIRLPRRLSSRCLLFLSPCPGCTQTLIPTPKLQNYDSSPYMPNLLGEIAGLSKTMPIRTNKFHVH